MMDVTISAVKWQRTLPRLDKLAVFSRSATERIRHDRHALTIYAFMGRSVDSEGIKLQLTHENHPILGPLYSPKALGNYVAYDK